MAVHRRLVVALAAIVSVSLGLGGCSSDRGDAVKAPAQPTAKEDVRMPEMQAPKNVVIMETSEGPVTIELWPDKAPMTVANFLRYVDEQFYDGTIFHRVMGNFMIQGGGFTSDLRQKRTHEPVKNEADNGCRNDRGTLAMARTGVVDSATAQFFINVVDNGGLNHRNRTQDGFGYCVFGKVVSGMDVVDRIKAVRTGSVGGFENVPLKSVVIKTIRRAP